MKKLIIIIIPTYNEEQIIQTTIKKILNQNNIRGYYKKIFIVDGCSTDNTIAKIKEIKTNKIIIFTGRKNEALVLLIKMQSEQYLN